MDASSDAAPVTRALLVLARSARGGVLTVRSGPMQTQIGVRDRRVLAVRVTPHDGDRLGDALRAARAWESDLSTPGPRGEPIGRWAIQHDVSPASAVSYALRQQLRRRVCRVFAWDSPSLTLSAEDPTLGGFALQEPPSIVDLVLAGLRYRMRSEPMREVRKRIGTGVLAMTSSGRELLESAALWPEEAAMIARLREGASVTEILDDAAWSVRAQRTLAALRSIGACAPPASRRGYALLLRKTRELRRAARPNEFLELPGSADASDARRALRRLAQELHPDRFNSDRSDAIQRASHDVMSALLVAGRCMDKPR